MTLGAWLRIVQSKITKVILKRYEIKDFSLPKLSYHWERLLTVVLLNISIQEW
jgi:hypothetical protein